MFWQIVLLFPWPKFNMDGHTVLWWRQRRGKALEKKVQPSSTAPKVRTWAGGDGQGQTAADLASDQSRRQGWRQNCHGRGGGARRWRSNLPELSLELQMLCGYGSGTAIVSGLEKGSTNWLLILHIFCIFTGGFLFLNLRSIESPYGCSIKSHQITIKSPFKRTLQIAVSWQAQTAQTAPMAPILAPRSREMWRRGKLLRRSPLVLAISICGWSMFYPLVN